jgi:PAS domain S-box-containing protein
MAPEPDPAAPAPRVRETAPFDAAFEASFDHLDGVGEATGDLIALADSEGLLTWVSSNWEAVVGRSREQTIGLAWPFVLRPEDRPRAEAALQRVVVRGAVGAVRGLVVLPDGRVRWLSWRIVHAADGTRMIVGRDATDRARDSSRRAEGAALFEEVAGRLRDVFWLTEVGPDPVRYVSPAFETLFGRPREQFYLSPDLWREAIHPDDRARVTTAAREREESGGYDEVYRILRPDGGVRWVRDRAFPVRDAAGQVTRVFGLAEDVTALREAQEAARVAQEGLARAQRLEALGRLAGGIAHDFNNLLTVILGWAALLEDRVADDEAGREAARAIRETGERAADLTRQLLAFSRSRILKLHAIRPAEALREIEPTLRRLLTGGSGLTTTIDRDAGWICCDASPFGQVVLNLVLNARDAMPHGGTVLVELKSSADHVTLVVSDTGIGMDAATRSRLFEPFFTTKAAGKGTGLGLATVHGIVSQSGGTIDVESEVGRGSTFRVSFPRAEPPTAEDAPPPAGERLCGTERILVVEDEPGVAKLARSILETEGYSVVPASTAREALEALRREGDEIDVVLCDVTLPDGNGRELRREALTDRPSLPFVLMSGYTDDLALRQGDVPARVAFVEKPFTAGRMLRAVREVLAE